MSINDATMQMTSCYAIVSEGRVREVLRSHMGAIDTARDMADNRPRNTIRVAQFYTDPHSRDLFQDAHDAGVTSPYYEHIVWEHAGTPSEPDVIQTQRHEPESRNSSAGVWAAVAALALIVVAVVTFLVTQHHGGSSKPSPTAPTSSSMSTSPSITSSSTSTSPSSTPSASTTTVTQSPSSTPSASTSTTTVTQSPSSTATQSSTTMTQSPSSTASASSSSSK